MKATVTFEVDVVVEVPDDLPEQVRQLARKWGENYVAVDASDEAILERIALIRGIRGFSHDESMTPELNQQVSVRVYDDDAIIGTSFDDVR